MEGRVNVFWNQAMVAGVVAVSGVGTQPMGQVMMGRLDMGLFEEKRNRNGMARRY